MNNIYANPVEIVKDVYIIKNDINDKVYIGQSANAEQRFVQHCKPSSVKENSLITKAIQKYGKEHFYFELLETKIANYNEREKYWIEYYNSLTPNGYNILSGGEEPPTYEGIKHPNASINNEEILNALKKDLKETLLSYEQLAIKYNTNKKTVLRINHGISYSSLEESYPLRLNKNINGNLQEEQVDEIIDILRFSYRQYGDIAKQYGVHIRAIQDINSGATHFRDNISYPIRKYKNSGQPALTYEQVTEVIKLLKETNLSKREIARMFNLKGHSTINAIDSGSALRYRRENEKYPIRNK